jgi:hypothetical protein
MIALLGAGAVAGAIGAATLTANAASSSSSSTTAPSSAPSGAPAGAPDGRRGPHGGGPGGSGHNPDETVVTGTKAATLRAAALAQVSGGTVDRIETDSGDAAYEVHMTNASGKPVTVKFDKDLKFINVESGMGK